nr:uncharacterized protein LOC110126300 [Odocoileus virginianus texanus]
MRARRSGNPRRRSTLPDKPGLGLEGPVHPQTNVSALGPGRAGALTVPTANGCWDGRTPSRQHPHLPTAYRSLCFSFHKEARFPEAPSARGSSCDPRGKAVKALNHDVEIDFVEIWEHVNHEIFLHTRNLDFPPWENNSPLIGKEAGRVGRGKCYILWNKAGPAKSLGTSRIQFYIYPTGLQEKHCDALNSFKPILRNFVISLSLFT